MVSASAQHTAATDGGGAGNVIDTKWHGGNRDDGDDGGHGGNDGNGGNHGDGSDPGDPERRADYLARCMRILKRVLVAVTIVALIVYFAVGAVALTLRYVIMPNVDRFRPKVEAIASKALNAPVHIGHIAARWQGFKPSFTVVDLRIGASAPSGDALAVAVPPASSPSAATGTTASAASSASAPLSASAAAVGTGVDTAPSARAGDDDAGIVIDRIDATLAWRSLLQFQPILSQLVAGHARVTASRDPAGRVFVGGIAIGQHHARNPYALPSWLLGQREIVIQDLDLRWIDQAGPGHGAPPPPPLQLAHARLALVNSGRFHRFGLQGHLAVDDADAAGAAPAAAGPQATPAAAGMPIDLRADFQHAPFRALLPGRAGRGNPENWRGDLYLAATQLDVAALNAYVDNTVGARAGQVDLHSWWQFDRGVIDSVHGALSGRGLALQLRQGLPPLRIPKIDTQFTADQHDGNYHASVRDLTLELDDQAALPDGTTLGRMLNVSRFDGAYQTPRVGRGEKITLSGDVLDIGLLADFSRTLPLPLRLKRNIDRYDPSGVLSDYALEWERDAPNDAAAASAARVQGDVPLRRYKLHARLDGVTLAAMPPRPGVNAAGHPHIGQPGFSNLRGVIDVDQDGGQVSLDSRNASVTIRGMFDNPTLPLDTLSGTARWQITPRGDSKQIDAHIENLHLSNPDVAGQVTARFRALLNKSQDGYLDLTATLDRANVPMVPRYLPTSIAPPVRQYLTRMLKAGVSHGVTVEAHGRLNDLPYPHGVYRVAGTGPSVTSATTTASSGATAAAASSATAHAATHAAASAAAHGTSNRAALPAPIDTPDDGAPAGGTSTFRVQAPFTDATADISPSDKVRLSNGEPERWPAFDGLAGRFFVDGRQLGFDIDGGHYRQVQIRSLQGRIADLGDRSSVLRIESQVHGPLADFVDFVGHSPLGYWSNQIAAPAKAQGNATLDLRLDVMRNTSAASPAGAITAAHAANAAAAASAATLRATATTAATGPSATASAPSATGTASTARPDPVQVVGTLHLERNRVTYGIAPPVDNVTGDVAFTTHTGTTHNLQGRFLGGDIRAEGAMTADGGLNIQVRGRVAPERVAGAGDPRYTPLLRRFSGMAPYQVQVRRSGHEPTRMTLRSDLTGLGIDLPAPLHKAPETPMAVSLDWRTVGAGGDNAGKPDGTAMSGRARTAGAVQRIDLVAGPVHAAYLRRSAGTAQSNPLLANGNAGTAAKVTSATTATGAANTPNATNAAPAGVIAGAIGLDRLPPMPDSGVLGELHAAQFDADAWRTVLADVERPAATPPPARPDFTPDPADASPDTDANRTGGGWLPDRFDIAVDDLHLLSRHWHDVRADGGRGARQGWHAQVTSREVAGRASWQPQGGSAVHARLTKLMIPASDPAAAQTAAPQQAQQQADAERTTRTLAAAPQTTHRFPAIDLVADQFGYDGKTFGKLSLLAHNVATADDTVWQVDDLSLAHPAATLHATGDWRVDKAGTHARTGVDFDVAIHDGGGLLGALGSPGTLKGGKGSLTGALNWNGNPGTPDLKTLDGTLKLDLQRGQFLKINPGAARLLGLLSMQGLVRFLQLDFKSVFGKGLAFNSLSGTTTVRNGIASTTDATLSTAPARVTMAGTANVVDKTQDFDVTVVPHLNAVSASIAAAIVNPVIGLSTLAAQLALSEPISRSLTRRYQVQGHWDKPEVRRVDNNRGNIAPTADLSALPPSAPAH